MTSETQITPETTTEQAQVNHNHSHTSSPPRPVINHYGEPIEELVKIPTEDNGEPLVDIFEVCPQLVWAHKSPRWEFPRTGLGRVTIAHMLKQAQESLPRGLHLQIIGVFRPFEVQK